MIPIVVPEINFSEVKKELEKVIVSGVLTKGPNVTRFEQLVANYVGTRFAFAATSCTAALHLSLAALGIKRGDEVLVSDFTFPATANVIVQLGATPVFVDICLGTFNIDVADLAAKITKKTKAIIPVDAFGCPADMVSIAKIAKDHQLAVIEDAACALGAEFKGKRAGSLGLTGCFSFHPRKTITTGEGGMLTTNDPALAGKIKILREHGGKFMKKKRYFNFVDAGFNYRMTEMQAVMGISQMRKLEVIIRQKIKMAAAYSERLGGVDPSQVKLPAAPAAARHTFQSYVIMLGKKFSRDKIIQKMARCGVETTLGTYALHAQPFFVKNFGYHRGQIKNSYEAFKRTLTLPLFSRLTQVQIDHVVGALKSSAGLK